jgi:hypothetical protein
MEQTKLQIDTLILWIFEFDDFFLGLHLDASSHEDIGRPHPRRRVVAQGPKAEEYDKDLL